MPQRLTAFTLAETLIVIGIIGVVAALTLPNLNYATGDKETVTRLKKAYSMLNEANDRAVATYGPISEWKSNEQCANKFSICWMKRVGEFLKVSELCNNVSSCNNFRKGSFTHPEGGVELIYKLPDGITFFAPQAWNNGYKNCDQSVANKDDICITTIYIDVNGVNKGKNDMTDVFKFVVSDSMGIMPAKAYPDFHRQVLHCLIWQNLECTWWALEYGNLDYLKTHDQGICNDNPSIKLDGVNNTSCH